MLPNLSHEACSCSQKVSGHHIFSFKILSFLIFYTNLCSIPNKNYLYILPKFIFFAMDQYCDKKI